MSIYFVNENDQLEINFESLEMVTSSEFTRTVQYAQDSCNAKIKHVFDCLSSLSVYMYNSDTGIYAIYTFYKVDGSIVKTFVSKQELKVLKKIEGDLNV